MEKNLNLIPISSTKKYKRDWRTKNRKTFDGYSRQVYASQKHACNLRDMNKPTYSLQEFQEWLRGQDVFWDLFNEWKKTGNRKIAPSVDRKDNRKSYTFENIQVITLWDNLFIKGQRERIVGTKVWKNSETGKEHINRLAEIGKENFKKLIFDRVITCVECGEKKIVRSMHAKCCDRLCEQRNRRRRLKNE